MIQTTIQGIPCLVEVTHFYHQPQFLGSPWLCDSDMDYYGYTELEFNVYDRDGYPDIWLERKITDKDQERIKQEILDDYRRGPDGD